MKNAKIDLSIAKEVHRFCYQVLNSLTVTMKGFKNHITEENYYLFLLPRSKLSKGK